MAELRGARVALLMESDYFEPEIFYYQRRFAEEGVELTLMTRLWGQRQITFTGHEYRAPLVVDQSLEGLSDDDLRGYDAVIVPSGMVADRLRFSEKPRDLSPATELMLRAFALPEVLKGVICHGMWLLAKVPQTVRGRPVTCHNNLVGDVVNMGAEYRDEDVVIDGDLVTGRSGAHAHLFARALIGELTARRAAS
ncbi:thiamine biosynthesis protein ThiJ [Spongiactinospora rosea]|uniref:Thiamine biosynthesis protein ThiJ n=1 Tax=Spongiactinospora rosea TaxID=2248750 RepID=A0A366LN03_9ACTN|nr:DJ-1/PfpI family protein [Spongiactinospora rosea]RBQ15271.1 thiamine biosynthesis protein ThiJ [Spongiactinospora rosea]